MKEKIAVDICNTLVDINYELEKKGFKRIKGGYYFNGIPSGFFKEHLEVFLNAKPFEGAEKTVQRLSEHYEIIYITNRPNEAEKVTRESLFGLNDFPEGKIVFSVNKVFDFKREGCCLAIDDAPDVISDYIKAGIRVLIHSRDYNTRFAGARFTDWNNLVMPLRKDGAIWMM